MIHFLRFLFLFKLIFNLNTATNAESEYKCISDGLFEDENDCQMYYECTWIGSAFEKQEHLKCDDKLIYNPRKHRCENVFEFESQFAKGIQTGEELLEFMRFRNCIGSKNIVNDMYGIVNFEKTSPPADYYPHVALDNKNLYQNEENAFTSTESPNENSNLQPSYNLFLNNQEVIKEDLKNIDEERDESQTTRARNRVPTDTNKNLNQTEFYVSTKLRSNTSLNFNNSELFNLSSSLTTKNINKNNTITTMTMTFTNQTIFTQPTFDFSNSSTNTSSNMMIDTTPIRTTITTKSNKPNITEDFDSLFLMEDERIYFGKKSYFDSLSKNSSNFTDNKDLKKLLNNEKKISLFGSEKKRTLKAFNKKMNNSNGLYTTKIFKFHYRKTVLEANLDRLSTLKNSSKKSTTEAKVLVKLNEPINLEKEDENLLNNSRNDFGLKSKPASPSVIILNYTSNATINEPANFLSNETFNNKTNSVMIQTFNQTLNQTTDKIQEPKLDSFVLRKRRLLSINELDDISSTFHMDDDDLSSTTLLEDEIESTDESYHDKDQIVHEFTNNVMNKMNSNLLKKNINSKEYEKEFNIIDSIEQHLSKLGNNKTSKEILLNNQTKRVILKSESDTTFINNQAKQSPKPPVLGTSLYFSSLASFPSLFSSSSSFSPSTFSSTSPTAITTNDSKLGDDVSLTESRKTTNGYLKDTSTSKRNNKASKSSFYNPFKKPLKFLKKLPKVNYSLFEERKQLHFDKLNGLLNFSSKKTKETTVDYTTAKFYINTTNITPTTPRGLENEQDNEDNLRKKFTSPARSERQFNRTTRDHTDNSYTTFIARLTSSTVTESPIPFTTSYIWNNTLVNTIQNTKPIMQTYKINQTKKLPNQFASLRLNYDQDNLITKINEVERGGKFQRLRLVPADTLIECKENDFGLECSCSITLSPPKCKQLINSFLSSCRILGCKNNGKCINMAYKYPIPYVCSCPSDYMGSYCEMPRNDLVENDVTSKEENLNINRRMNKQNKLVSQNVSMSRSQNIAQMFANNTTSFEFTTPVKNIDINSTKAIPKQTTSKLELSIQKSITNSDLNYQDLCIPNPCLNNGKCTILKNDFECICLNSSFIGKFCESFRIPTTPTTTRTNPMPKTTKEAAYNTDNLNKKTPVSNTFLTNQVKYEPTKSYVSTSRSYFWQCPSNCFNNLGHGYCSLSSSGYPYCVCRVEWTGIDCSQKNYCLINKCENNSTCSNYPDMRSYLCICSKGFSGRFCELDNRYMKEESSTLQSQFTERKFMSDSLNLSFNNSKSAKLKSSDIVPPKNPCLTEKCKNNGTCVMSFSHAKNKFSFVCKCPIGFYGDLCEIGVNPCEPNPCKPPANKCIAYGYKNFKCACINNDCSFDTTLAPVTNHFKYSTHQTSTNIPRTPILSNPLTSMSFDLINFTPNNKLFKNTNNNILTRPNHTSIPVKLNLNRSQILMQPKKKLNDILDNPCKRDLDLCRKYPYGNGSFICVKSFVTQDYTLCLPTSSMNCKDANPCLNGGICVDDDSTSYSNTKQSWKCLCSSEFTGRLCESEICSPVHRLFSNHTMCLPDAPNLFSGGVFSTDIELILDMHNTLRRQVAPIASNMQKMYWDVRLQHLAQKRAQLCSVENTGILMRQQPGYGIVIGENLAAGYEKWSHVLTSWMSERKNFIYKSTSPTDNLQAGHYTQMIYSSASRIGCGYAQCANSTYERYFVCYYGEMQTYYSRYEPYQDGKVCSACQKNCNNGLCDCKGAYCLNGGTLDLNTCTCTCPYSTFSGKYCENVICPREDSPFCSQNLFEDKCWLYPVVRATCPYMCSLCSKSSENFNSTITTPKLYGSDYSYF